MKKSEIFALVLSSVSEVTELSSETILSKSHREDIAQARMLLVFFCYEKGLYPSQIAGFVGISRRQINRLICNASAVLATCTSSRAQICFFADAIGTKLGHNLVAIKS